MFYFFAGLISAGLAASLTPAVRRLAIKNKIVDQPGGRRVNSSAVPRMGGLALVGAFWLVTLAIALIFPERLNFSGRTIGGLDANLLGVLFGAIILVIAGIVDDVRGLSPIGKLTAQLLAAACVPLFGIDIQWLAHPLGGANIELVPWLDHLLIVLWIVAVINVVNWLDGLDGLATGVGAIAALILFALSLAAFVNQPATALIAIILFGSALGFLPYNFNPAKIFLGDTGSMFLGFMLAILAVISGGKLATAGLILGIPILDAGWVIFRRLISGQAPWSADRKHLHHRLLDAGLSQRQTVMLYWAFAALFGSLALAVRTYGKTLIGLAMLGIMLVLGLVLVALERRKGATGR